MLHSGTSTRNQGRCGIANEFLNINNPFIYPTVPKYHSILTTNIVKIIL